MQISFVCRSVDRNRSCSTEFLRRKFKRSGAPISWWFAMPLRQPTETWFVSIANATDVVPFAFCFDEFGWTKNENDTALRTFPRSKKNSNALGSNENWFIRLRISGFFMCVDSRSFSIINQITSHNSSPFSMRFWISISLLTTTFAIEHLKLTFVASRIRTIWEDFRLRSDLF